MCNILEIKTIIIVIIIIIIIITINNIIIMTGIIIYNVQKAITP